MVVRPYSDLLRRVAQQAAVVLLGDFNLHFDAAWGAAIGELVWPHPHPSPPRAFFDILHACFLWIPSTYEPCHPGPSTTWQPPGGVGHARIDYIAIPQDWQVPQGGSSTVPSLDWGQTRTDHVALYRPASTALCGSAPLAEAGPLASTPLPCAPEGRQTIRQLCREIPLQPWDMDVHRHSQAITDHLWRGLQPHFPVNKTPVVASTLLQRLGGSGASASGCENAYMLAPAF